MLRLTGAFIPERYHQKSNFRRRRGGRSCAALPLECCHVHVHVLFPARAAGPAALVCFMPAGRLRRWRQDRAVARTPHRRVQRRRRQHTVRRRARAHHGQLQRRPGAYRTRHRSGRQRRGRRHAAAGPWSPLHADRRDAGPGAGAARARAERPVPRSLRGAAPALQHPVPRGGDGWRRQRDRDRRFARIKHRVGSHRPLRPGHPQLHAHRQPAHRPHGPHGHTPVRRAHPGARRAGQPQYRRGGRSDRRAHGRSQRRRGAGAAAQPPCRSGAVRRPCPGRRWQQPPDGRAVGIRCTASSALLRRR